MGQLDPQVQQGRVSPKVLWSQLDRQHQVLLLLRSIEPRENQDFLRILVFQDCQTDQYLQKIQQARLAQTDPKGLVIQKILWDLMLLCHLAVQLGQCHLMGQFAPKIPVFQKVLSVHGLLSVLVVLDCLRHQGSRDYQKDPEVQQAQRHQSHQLHLEYQIDLKVLFDHWVQDFLDCQGYQVIQYHQTGLLVQLDLYHQVILESLKTLGYPEFLYHHLVLKFQVALMDPAAQVDLVDHSDHCFQLIQKVQ